MRRFVRGEDLTAVAAVYAAHCVERSLTTVRPLAYWERHFSWIAGEIEELFLVAESEGQIVAYSRCEGGRDRLTLSECCYLPGHEQAAVALFDAVLAHAVKRRFAAVQGHLPADHPALAAARELPGFAASESGLLLFRLVNLRRLLERLQPLLSERAHDEDVEGDLTLRVGDQAAGLQIRPGWVSVGDPGETPVEVEPRCFFELLFGAVEPAAGVSELPPAPAKLLSGLFPPGAPVYWRTDVV